MRYKFTATDKSGRLKEGVLSVASDKDVINYLITNSLQPISIKVDNKEENKAFKTKGSIKEVDKIFLARHLSLMLRLGTDLFKALEILITDTESPTLKAILVEIQESLEKGQPFHVTFARYPEHFSEVFTSLVEAGEASGNLETTFKDLAVMLEKNEDLRKKIKGALFYPIILIIGSISILTFLVTFTIPKISTSFTSTSFNIPTFSKIVFGVSNFLSTYIFIFIPLGLSLIGLFYYYFFRTIKGRSHFFSILSRIPIINKIISQINISRFSSTFSSLLRSGVPIVKSLEIVSNVVGDENMRLAILNIAHEGISKGLSLGESFKRERNFPKMITSLITISEKAGHIDEVLESLSSFYEGEIESSLKNLITLIEPIMLVFIGGIVALIALSVIVPIYQLVGQI